jgi:hypothetical protein
LKNKLLTASGRFSYARKEKAMAQMNIKVDCNLQTVFEGRLVDLYIAVSGRKMRFQKVKVMQSDDRLFLSDGERVVILNWKYVEMIIEEKNNENV